MVSQVASVFKNCLPFHSLSWEGSHTPGSLPLPLRCPHRPLSYADRA